MSLVIDQPLNPFITEWINHVKEQNQVANCYSFSSYWILSRNNSFIYFAYFWMFTICFVCNATERFITAQLRLLSMISEVAFPPPKLAVWNEVDCNTQHLWDWVSDTTTYSISSQQQSSMILIRQWYLPFSCEAHGGTALCLVAVSFVGCSKEWTLAMLTMAVCIEGALYSGFCINQLDLAPNFAGTLYGIINGVATVNSWLAPLVVAALTEGQVNTVWLQNELTRGCSVR